MRRRVSNVGKSNKISTGNAAAWADTRYHQDSSLSVDRTRLAALAVSYRRTPEIFPGRIDMGTFTHGYTAIGLQDAREQTLLIPARPSPAGPSFTAGDLAGCDRVASGNFELVGAAIGDQDPEPALRAG